MAPEVQPRGADRESGVDQEVPRLILGRAARPAAGAVHGAAVGEAFPKQSGAMEDAGRASGGGGGDGVGGAAPVHRERGTSEGSREALDRMDMKGKAAVEAAVAADVGEGLLDRVPAPKGRRPGLLLILLLVGVGGLGVGGGLEVRSAGGDGPAVVGGGPWASGLLGVDG